MAYRSSLICNQSCFHLFTLLSISQPQVDSIRLSVIYQSVFMFQDNLCALGGTQQVEALDLPGKELWPRPD